MTHPSQSLQKLYLIAYQYRTLEVEIELAQGLPYVNHWTNMKSYAQGKHQPLMNQMVQIPHGTSELGSTSTSPWPR